MSLVGLKGGSTVPRVESQEGTAQGWRALPDWTVHKSLPVVRQGSQSQGVQAGDSVLDVSQKGWQG